MHHTQKMDEKLQRIRVEHTSVAVHLYVSISQRSSISFQFIVDINKRTMIDTEGEKEEDRVKDKIGELTTTSPVMRITSTRITQKSPSNESNWYLNPHFLRLEPRRNRKEADIGMNEFQDLAEETSRTDSLKRQTLPNNTDRTEERCNSILALAQNFHELHSNALESSWIHTEKYQTVLLPRRKHGPRRRKKRERMQPDHSISKAHRVDVSQITSVVLQAELNTLPIVHRVPTWETRNNEAFLYACKCSIPSDEEKDKRKARTGARKNLSMSLFPIPIHFPSSI